MLVNTLIFSRQKLFVRIRNQPVMDDGLIVNIFFSRRFGHTRTRGQNVYLFVSIDVQPGIHGKIFPRLRPRDSTHI